MQVANELKEKAENTTLSFGDCLTFVYLFHYDCMLVNK